MPDTHIIPTTINPNISQGINRRRFLTGTGGLGYEKSQQVEVKAPAGLQVGCIEAEMAEAPNLEWSVERDPTDVVLTWHRGCHGDFSS